MTELLSILGLFAPLFIILWLANVAEKRREQEEPYQGVALVAYVLLGALYIGGLGMGMLAQVAALVANAAGGELPTAGNIAVMPIASLGTVALGLWVPSLVGLLLLLPPVRRVVMQPLPLDPDNPVHGVGLALSMLVLINLVVTLGVGLENLADLVSASEEAQGGSNTFVSVWSQQILTALLAMVGVGWLSRRSLGETLDRLGIRRITGRQWLVGIGLGFGLVPVVMLLEFLTSLIGVGASPDVERLTEELLGGLTGSPFGILTLGLSAALGEETLFRGALTPRFGILLSSLLFALLHSNYGISLSTVIVFGLGLLLAWERIRHSTSTSMLTHAVYNMVLGLLAYLSVSWLDF